MTLKAFIAIMVSPINHYGEVVDLPADAYQENDRLARLIGIWAYLWMASVGKLATGRYSGSWAGLPAG